MSHKESQSDKIIDLNLFELLSLENKMVNEWDEFIWYMIDQLMISMKYNQARMQQLVQGLFLALEDYVFFQRLKP